MMIVIILTPGCLINPPDIFYRIYSSSSMNGNDFTVLLGIRSSVLSQNIINITLLNWSFLLKIDNLKTIIIAFMKTPKKKKWKQKWMKLQVIFVIFHVLVVKCAMFI